jgi:hypothetical protein
MVTVVMVEKRPSDIRAEERRRPAKSPRPRAAPPVRASAPVAPLASGAGSGTEASLPSLAASPAAVSPLSANERFRRISVCAYFKAEQRGFEPGHMWEDWLAAEREVDAAAIAAMDPVPSK